MITTPWLGLLAVSAAAAVLLVARQCLTTIRRDRSKAAPAPPVHFGLPLLGSSLGFLSKGGDAYTPVAAKLGQAFQTYLLGEWTVVASGAGNMHKIFMGEHTLVQSDWPESVMEAFGPANLGMARVATHTALRRALTPIFSPENLVGCAVEIGQIMSKYVERWTAAGKVRAADDVKAIALEVACVAFFHIDFNEETAVKIREHFINFSVGMFLPTWTSGYKKALAARTYIQDQIEKTLELRMEGKTFHKDLLQGMVDSVDAESGRKLTVPELKDLVLGQLFAGHDTTASAMCRMLQLFDQNPAVLARALEENREVAKKFPGNELYSLKALEQMPYLDGFIMECLRSCPPLGFNFRRSRQAFELQDGFGGVVQVPAGAKILVSMTTSARNMDSANTDKCLPERWAGARRMGSMEQLQMGIAPFAAGNRKCIGFPVAELELRIFGTLVLQEMEFSLDAPNAPWREFPIPFPSDGMPMRASKRSS